MDQNNYKLSTKKPNTISLFLLCSFASLGAALIAPALPKIAISFGISSALAKLNITTFLMGYAIGQLIYGPIANRFGRKFAYYFGIILATAGSIFSIISASNNSFYLLLLGRFFQALGMSAGLVVTYTIINDYYYPHQSRRVISYLTAAPAIVPSLALLLGGLLVEYFNWYSCFYFLLFYGLLLFIPVILMDETAQKLDTRSLYPKELAKNYSIPFKNSFLILTSIGGSMPVTCIYLFVSHGPFIGINYLGLRPSEYGLFGMIPYAGMVLGSLISARLSKSAIPLSKIILCSYGIQVISIFAMIMLFFTGIINIYSFIIPMSIAMLAGWIILGNLVAISTIKLEDKANASAVMQFVIITPSVIVTLISGSIQTDSPLLLPILLFAAMIVMFLSGMIFKHKNFSLQTPS